MEVENHKLVAPNVKQMHCNKKSSLLPVTDTIVIHYTGGGNAMSSAQLLARADTSVSAHLVIARSGQILQLLPFNVKAWHAGYSSLEGRQNVNNFSIGIELDNAGPLHRRGQGWFTWFNKQIMMKSSRLLKRDVHPIGIPTRRCRSRHWWKCVGY